MQNNSFTKSDERVFLSSFITPELAKRAGIFRVDSVTGAELVGKTPTAKQDLSGLIFPYFLPEQTNARNYRLRLDNPEKEQKSDGTTKPKNKYLTAYGSQNKFYFPPGVTNEMLADVNLPIVICEGEKKCLALWRVATNDLTEKPKFLPLGIAGVWNFRDEIKQPKAESIGTEKVKRPMADFGLLKWTNRRVYILYDADIETNFQIVLASIALAQTLKSKLADVFISSMPLIENCKGIDDLCAFWEQSTDTKTAIANCLKIIETAKPFEADKFYLPNGLILTFANGERSKKRLSVSRDSEIVHLDEINLTKAKERDCFIDSLELSTEEKNVVNQCLMQLSMLKPQTETRAMASEEKFILSQVLSDGRILEALSTGQLAVYDAQTDSVEYAESVIDDGICYKPLDDKFVKRMLVSKVGDYESEQSLVSEISSYIYRHYDMTEFHRKICAYYILLTYVIDAYFVVPYLHPRGLHGEGKTRFGQTIISACYRAYSIASANIAPLFRLITKYTPTLFIDEFNPKGDDKKDVIDLMLMGNKRGQKIIRCRTNQPEELDEFDGFGCKIVSSYAKFGDDALESRCIDIQCKETKRLDIQFTDTGQIQVDAVALREKLLRFRLRNLNRDFTAEIIKAENLLKKEVDDSGNLKIRARFIEKMSPLLALIQDDTLQKDLIALLVNETTTAKTLKQEGIVYEITVAIHEILFDIEDGKPITRKLYQFERDELGQIITGLNKQPSFDVSIKDGKPCDALFIPNILQRLNAEKKKHDEIKPQYFGRTLHSQIGLTTAQEWQRSQSYHFKRGAKMVVINRQKLIEKFKEFGLPIPDDFNVAEDSDNFNVANVANDVKPNQTNGLDVATLNQKTDTNNFNVATCNHSKTNDLDDLATLATLNLPKTADNGFESGKRVTIEI